MFTGMIEGRGTIRSIKRQNYTAIYEFEVDFDLGDTNVGDSISVCGCCLTVTSCLGNRFWADLSDESLRVTNLGGLAIGGRVNVERALKVGSRLGGHIVQGHVDGVGKIVCLKDVTAGRELEIQVPKRLTKYIVEKGSIAVDGVSLTINKIKGEVIFIRIVPHTLKMTTFDSLQTGAPVNLEVDILGKYVEKLRLSASTDDSDKREVTEEFLRKHGF